MPKLAGVPAEDGDQLRNALGAATGDQAFGLATGLPPAIQHYAAGAAAFHAGKMDEAQSHFAAVLALPDAQRRIRAVWAAYMSGKLNAAYDGVRQGD